MVVLDVTKTVTGIRTWRCKRQCLFQTGETVSTTSRKKNTERRKGSVLDTWWRDPDPDTSRWTKRVLLRGRGNWPRDPSFPSGIRRVERGGVFLYLEDGRLTRPRSLWSRVIRVGRRNDDVHPLTTLSPWCRRTDMGVRWVLTLITLSGYRTGRVPLDIEIWLSVLLYLGVETRVSLTLKTVWLDSLPSHYTRPALNSQWHRITRVSLNHLKELIYEVMNHNIQSC